jgi:hypothetical protein
MLEGEAVRDLNRGVAGGLFVLTWVIALHDRRWHDDHVSDRYNGRLGRGARDEEGKVFRVARMPWLIHQLRLQLRRFAATECHRLCPFSR